jgi:hypothetical protein
MKNKIIRRAFDIYESQDKAIEEWARKLPDVNKSLVARIVIELGLADLKLSTIPDRLIEGSIRIVREDLKEREPRSKKKPSKA